MQVQARGSQARNELRTKLGMCARTEFGFAATTPMSVTLQLYKELTAGNPPRYTYGVRFPLFRAHPTNRVSFTHLETRREGAIAICTTSVHDRHHTGNIL